METNQHTHLILEDEYYIPILQLDRLMPKGTGDDVTCPRPHEEACPNRPFTRRETGEGSASCGLFLAIIVGSGGQRREVPLRSPACPPSGHRH